MKVGGSDCIHLVKVVSLSLFGIYRTNLDISPVSISSNNLEYL